MKISTFNPMILSPKAEELIELFEALGFEQKHAPTVDTGESMVTSVRMEDANGFNIDIAGVESLPQDMSIIRMNVDDYDEAVELLESKGFVHEGPKDSVETATSRSAMYVSPTGFAFDVCQHIKD